MSDSAFVNITGAKAWITVWINGTIAYRIATKEGT